MYKTLVLIDNLFYQYSLDGEEYNGIRFLPVMRSNSSNKIMRAVRKVHLTLPLPLKKIWFDHRWMECIQNYGTIVLGDAGNTANVTQYIHRKYKDKRIIVWYRNSVQVTVSPNEFDRSFCELWSFDQSDCKQYNMNYNPQFYMRCKTYQELPIIQDAFFIGQDKGRLKILSEMEETLKKHGYQTKFCIVGVNSVRMSYGQILNQISKSRVIVDCQCTWQDGITLRPLEALCYGKKLITNNKKIKKLDFYNPRNIFVWGEDNPDSLDQFLNTPCVENEEMKKKYGLKSWVDHFYSAKV